MQQLTIVIGQSQSPQEEILKIVNNVREDSIINFIDTNVHIDPEYNPCVFHEKFSDRFSLLKDCLKTNTFPHKHKVQISCKCYSLTKSCLIAHEETIGEINY